MDLKQIEKLMSAMEQSRIKRVSLKREDFEIEIERECASSAPLGQPYVAHQVYATPPPPLMEMSSKPFPEHANTKGGEKAGGLFVTSPMVGTFYASPSPEDPPFIKLGDTVSEDTVVCIIEAMKVMNEVKANVRGTVSEILLKNGEPVEFGSHIFRISPL